MLERIIAAGPAVYAVAMVVGVPVMVGAILWQGRARRRERRDGDG